MDCSHTHCVATARSRRCPAQLRCSPSQVTAMHLAAEHGHFALITLLMEHGGDATALDGHRCAAGPRPCPKL